MSSRGRTFERPPPDAPPLIPKTGPSAGWRKVTIAFFPNLHKPIASPIEVTVLPSPKGVGLIAVTRIYFAC